MVTKLRKIEHYPTFNKITSLMLFFNYFFKTFLGKTSEKKFIFQNLFNIFYEKIETNFFR